MRVSLFQFTPEHGRIAANLARIQAALARVETDLVVLPELCLSGYLFRNRAELCACAEPVPSGPSVTALSRLCRSRRLNLVLGLAESEGSRIFNTAVLLASDGTIHRYRKAHLFLDEKDLFDPGDSPFPVFTVAGVRMGMLICFDYFFPESSRSLALKGAQIVCHPANLVLDYAQWMTLTRAAENRVFWILCNRTGTEILGSRQMRFTGQSQFVDPFGRLLARAGARGERLLTVQIDPSLALNKNVTPRNHCLNDRRPGLYGL